MPTPWNDLQFPICITGSGSPVLLLHGFDSCFLEFRRLAPLLDKHHQLLIPDLLGFGFCPRPPKQDFGPEQVLQHLDKIINHFPIENSLGVIGASMGGAVAMELARRHPDKINLVMLLAPAGLTGKPMPVPPILDHFGVWFLNQQRVRRSLCRQAFADPEGSVGAPEEQIASMHLEVEGWAHAMRSFARSGGFGGQGSPLPQQPLHVIWGKNDRILNRVQKQGIQTLLHSNPTAKLEEVNNCGHLPHLDCPAVVAKRWLEMSHPDDHP